MSEVGEVGKEMALAVDGDKITIGSKKATVATSKHIAFS